jgi:hypothetical protein
MAVPPLLWKPGFYYFDTQIDGYNGGVVKTWTANNASSVTGTYADWYSTGDTEWIIEVTGTTSTGTTVTWNGAVRVAKS